MPPHPKQHVQLLLQSFNKVDRERQGYVKAMEAIKLVRDEIIKKPDRKAKEEEKLKRALNTTQTQLNEQPIDGSPNQGQSIAVEALMSFHFYQQRVIFQNEGEVTFDQFLAMLHETKCAIAASDQANSPTSPPSTPTSEPPNRLLLEFMKLLEEYRRKCQDQSQYLQAQKAHQKISEIRDKELRRHKQKLLFEQRSKVTSVTELQQSKVMQFRAAWSDYMNKYEDAAMNSLEKLKARHLRQMEQQEDRIKQYFSNYMKPSKRVLDLRVKERSLVKLRQYQQAEKVKAAASSLEEQEKEALQEEINQRIQRRKEKIQKQQQNALMAHLKRIQNDRNQQMKQQKFDSDRMLVKLRNIQNDIIQKQSIEIRETLDTLRETMSLTSGQLLRNSPTHIKPRQKGHSLQTIPPEAIEEVPEISDKQPKKSTEKGGRGFRIRVNSMQRTISGNVGAIDRFGTMVAS